MIAAGSSGATAEYASRISALLLDRFVPQDPLRNELIAWLVYGPVSAVVVTIIYALVTVPVVVPHLSDIPQDVLRDRIGFALAVGVTAGAAFGLGSPTPIRYAITSLAGTTAGPHPRRLGRFLDWAYQAGVVRIAGIAYQFRHRELQDRLTPASSGWPAGAAADGRLTRRSR
jgi:hypothetical protein